MLKRNLLYSALFLATATTMSAETAKWTVGSDTWDVEITNSEVCPGVKYTLVNWVTQRSSSYPGSRLHVIEADLTNPDIAVENVKPDAMTGVRSLTNHAKSVHKAGYQVVGGANGNFWSTSAEGHIYQCMGAQPHGVCVSNGIMYTDPNVGSFPHCGGPTNITGLLAFDENGKCYLDYTLPQKANNAEGSGVQFAAINTRDGSRLALDMCNRFVASGSASIFTRQYGTSKAFRVGDLTNTWTPTKGTGNYIEVILDYAEGVTAMNYGGLTDYIIKEIRFNPETIGSLGDHDLAIVGRNAYATKPYQQWKTGDIIQLDTKLNFRNMGSPEKVVNAISGNVLAMKDGVIAARVNQEAYNKNIYPRTVYGTNADGTKLWIFVCEHNAARQNKYYGFRLEQICIMARDYFGVNNATQVDCGGSSQMYLNGTQVAQSYDNGGVRNVYNGLFVIYKGDKATLNAPGANEPPTPVEPDPDEGWTDSGVRAHYAYGLTAMENTEVPTISYSLTGAVKSAEIVLTNRDNASDVVTIDAATSEGVNTMVINDSRLTPGATYDWTVKVNSFPVPATAHFFHDAPAKNDARGGVGIVTNPESTAFGKIITSMGYAQGFGLYNPDLTKDGIYHAGMSPWAADNRSSTFRIAMRENSVAYACDFSDKGAGYWRFDPENPSATPTNLIGGVNDGTGCFKMPGSSVCVGSGATGIGFQGTGKDTRLWVFAEDWPSGNAATKIILTRWDIGSAESITTAASASYPQYTGQKTFANQNGSITPTPDGIFAAQIRGKGNNSTGCPGFIYTDVTGNMLYNSGNHPNLFNSCAGSVAISEDLSLFAVAGYNENIKIFNVTWNGNVPTFTLLTQVNGTGHCTDLPQLAFDPAGNLFAWQRSTNSNYSGLFGYSYKNDNPTASTPAKAGYAIVAVDPAGIDAIGVDNNPDPIYYTIQGVKVDASNLTPGIYIKVTGAKSEKVLIK